LAEKERQKTARNMRRCKEFGNEYFTVWKISKQ